MGLFVRLINMPGFVKWYWNTKWYRHHAYQMERHYDRLNP